jgi:hypothetical protein
MVKVITKYAFDGKEYANIKDIKSRIEDIIGEELLDRFNKSCNIRHKDLFVMLEIICKPEVREVLLKYLNVKITLTNEDDEEEEWNILDLK